jgi:hypothetical protein
MDIDLKIDIKQATAYLTKYERRIIPRATNRALNNTAKNVRTTVSRHIAKRTGLKVAEVNAGVRLVKSNFSTLRALLIGTGRAVNLIRFVSKGKQHPGAFNKGKGVIANAWRSRKVYPGTFIVRGKGHGKPLVMARTSGRRNPLKAIQGPSVRLELVKPHARRLIMVTVIKRFRINIVRDLKYYLSGL